MTKTFTLDDFTALGVCGAGLARVAAFGGAIENTAAGWQAYIDANPEAWRAPRSHASKCCVSRESRTRRRRKTGKDKHLATGSRTPHTIAPEADQLEQALRAAGVDPDDALSFPYWNVFVNRGLRAALAALESRTDMEYKLEYKPLGGQRQQRSAPNGADELTDADRAQARASGDRGARG